LLFGSYFLIGIKEGRMRGNISFLGAPEETPDNWSKRWAKFSFFARNTLNKGKRGELEGFCNYSNL
jgi:hypothetical protein